MGEAQRLLMGDLASGSLPEGVALAGELEGWRLGLGLGRRAWARPGEATGLSLARARRLLALLSRAGAHPHHVRRARPGGGAASAVAWLGAPQGLGPPRGRHPRRYCRGLVRGVTLAVGYLGQPERGYHLEWRVPEPGAPLVARCLGHLGVSRVGSAEGRRRGTRLYLEDGEAIAQLLTELGAAQSLLSWENARALRQVRGRVNREVNGETANLRRAVEAGLRQARLLGRLDPATLPDPLRSVALARVRHPEASLGELAQMLGLGRSAVHHRLRLLVARAREEGSLP
jgi:transposase-like protein